MGCDNTADGLIVKTRSGQSNCEALEAELNPLFVPEIGLEADPVLVDAIKADIIPGR